MRIHKLITLAFTIHSGGLVLSQSDTLNTYNARGKKDGYWLVYFDKHLQKVDSTKAFYYGFDLYVDGANRTEIFSMKRIDTSRIEHVNRLTAKSGTFTLLDGDFVYYRLRQVDFDGKETYSHVILVKNEKQTRIIDIFPNPTLGKLTITGVELESDCSVSVFDLAGKMVKKLVLDQDGQADLSDLHSGLYIIAIIAKNETKNFKLLKG